ncbi:hypothetical protein UFOVP116_277 [uncultured Caudovirales phage]|uniref:Uncharacterized protein n=1 Tax=uncultured Caudovirales phage TaxID=2100421 RepID=A0A6J5L7Y0_9CAUD|nr:hypothetical protein UFOVP116_277 [uncultured Caudovirales phage]
MSEDLTELYDADGRIKNSPKPVWSGKLSKEERHELYLQVKESLPRRRQFCDVTLLEQAVEIYERNNGIVG